MTNQAVTQRKLVVRESFFKRHENLTVLSIFVGFALVIIILQLFMTGGQRFHTFISPVSSMNTSALFYIAAILLVIGITSNLTAQRISRSFERAR